MRILVDVAILLTVLAAVWAGVIFLPISLAFKSVLFIGATWMLLWCSVAITGSLSYYAEQYLMIYGPSIAAMKLTHRIGQFRFLRQSGMHVHAAMNLGTTYIDIGDLSKAEFWACKALACRYDGDWMAQSEALSVAGEVAYHQGDFGRAKDLLIDSLTIYRDENSSLITALQNSDEVSEYNAKNLQMLGDIALQENELEKAELFFATGTKLRQKVKSLVATALVYKLYCEGRMHLAEGDTARATESFLSACQAMPSKVKHRQHLDVVVLLAQALNLIGTLETDVERNRLLPDYNMLHSNQINTIANVKLLPG